MVCSACVSAFDRILEGCVVTDPSVPRRASRQEYSDSLQSGSGRQLEVPAASRLNGTGLIADDLYLLSHDERTGRPRLRARPLGIGLSGALLTELMLGDSIGLDRGGVLVPRRRRPADDLGQRVQAQIAAEGAPRPVRDWLLYLARSAPKDVAGRLERAGYLQHVRGAIPGLSGRLVPVDTSWALAPVLRVRSALDSSCAPDPRHAILVGLAWASGLSFRIAQSEAAGNRSLEEPLAYLIPGLRFIITQTQVAVQNSVLPHRA
jgi:hypothetical protein